ncbi:MAG: hypothetical protein ACM3PS_15825 [Syntrophothermus sp.]
MAIQLAFDFSPPAQHVLPDVQKEAWLDVTDIARGLGFTEAVEISKTMNDALEPHQDEPEEAYDQRLFDCLWLAHLQWTLSDREAATINFFFERTNSTMETRLRIRVEYCEGVVRLVLLNQAICPLFD